MLGQTGFLLVKQENGAPHKLTHGLVGPALNVQLDHFLPLRSQMNLYDHSRPQVVMPVATENSVRSENKEVPIIREIMVATTMSSLFVALFALVASSFRTRAALQAEILALRHQLAVFQKNAPRRLRLQRCDRLLWVVLYRFWSGWRRCLQMVQPNTVLRWHRGAFAWHWTRKSRRLPGRPVAENIRDLIRRSNRQHEPIQPINICEKEEMIVRNTSSIANECRDSRPLWVVILLTTLFLASNLEADQQSWLVIAVL